MTLARVPQLRRPARGPAALRALALTVALGVAGCAGNGAKESFYALDDGGVVVGSTTALRAPGGQATGANRAAAGSVPGIVVSAVTIPELVDRPQIVTRDATSRVIVSEQNLWAESVRSGIARTLATRLARALSDAGRQVQVAAYPQSSIAEPVLRITVDVVRFDAVPNAEAVVDALWSIRRPADGMIRTGRITASAPITGTSYDAIVSGWNHALAVVDQDIATNVLTIGVDAAPAPPAVKR